MKQLEFLSEFYPASVLALILALTGVAKSIVQKNSLGLMASILALVTVFLPAITVGFRWYEPPAQT